MTPEDSRHAVEGTRLVTPDDGRRDVEGTRLVTPDDGRRDAVEGTRLAPQRDDRSARRHLRRACVATLSAVAVVATVVVVAGGRGRSRAIAVDDTVGRGVAAFELRTDGRARADPDPDPDPAPNPAPEPAPAPATDQVTHTPTRCFWCPAPTHVVPVVAPMPTGVPFTAPPSPCTTCPAPTTHVEPTPAPLGGSGDDAAAADDDGDDSVVSGDDVIDAAPSCTLYKRTHASVDPRGDGAFLRDYFGLSLTINETFSAFSSSSSSSSSWGDDPADASFDDGVTTTTTTRCATRVGVASMPGDFALHFFRSDVTPDGAIPVAEWVAYWHALHGGFEDGWDAFMANSVTFYAPDLTPFVRALRGGGVPTLDLVYNHTLEVALIGLVYVAVGPCARGESCGGGVASCVAVAVSSRTTPETTTTTTESPRAVSQRAHTLERWCRRRTREGRRIRSRLSSHPPLTPTSRHGERPHAVRSRRAARSLVRSLSRSAAATATCRASASARTRCLSIPSRRSCPAPATSWRSDRATTTPRRVRISLLSHPQSATVATTATSLSDDVRCT